MQGAVPTYKSSDRQDGAPPRVEGHGIGSIFRDYGERYISEYKPYIDEIKLIRAIRICKTAYLGGKRIECTGCGKTHYVYLSCGHSHCPICQSIKREQWIDKLRLSLLTVPYVHIVFTLPRELHRVTRQNKEVMYDLLMKSSWLAVKSVSADAKNVGGLPGMISVLHTFGSDMKYHVHTHTLVTFGGLEEGTGKWVSAKRKDRICPYTELKRTYREIFLAGLGRLYRAGKIDYHMGYEELCSMVETKGWVVHHTKPTIDTKILENYLARYINRVAISNSRVKYLVDQQEVRLLYNDYVNQREGEAAPKVTKEMDPLTFIHQFLQHKLPPYFQKSRRYGLHASATSRKYAYALSRLRTDGRVIRTVMQIVMHLLGKEAYTCEHCGSDKFVIEIVSRDRSWLDRHVFRKNGMSPNKSPP